ncbi:hypothetical protein PAXRUDRAFT_17774 [Paxillus rubicundulus Ve08.2h10]|uniref:Uncharacterized protein n=1 Tax=Paxillus rubicundulus Ve08.2h10 TaxID=930991 RepID=A0A0D0CP30_9AGAM|nr:hypothetical protein PAXRUDRAFT_17774 [Paxillus rubicundulus Ve08.2h10]
MDTGGSNVEGKEALDGKQGGEDGKKGKKKKEKKEKEKKKKKKKRGQQRDWMQVFHPLAGTPPQSIPWASALGLITTPTNPLLNPQPVPSFDHKDEVIKALKVQVSSLKKKVEGIPELELQVSSLAQVVEALQEQVQGQLAAPSFPTSSHRSLPQPASVSQQMQRLHLNMSDSHPHLAFLALEAKGRP